MAKKPPKTKSETSKPSKKLLGIDPSELQDLLSLLKNEGIVSFEWKGKESSFSFKTMPDSPGMVYSAPQAIFANNQTQSAPHANSGSAPKELAPGEYPAHCKKVLSPFVGTFYRSPSPGAEPYAKDGQDVRPGDVLCIVEAMKLMNEIESEFTGKLIATLVENGQPVEFGQPLFVIEPH